VDSAVADKMVKRHVAWVRYGATITSEQIAFAITNYQVEILQPWEAEVARQLKHARPNTKFYVPEGLRPGPIRNMRSVIHRR
jgi:hypothetical protein